MAFLTASFFNPEAHPAYFFIKNGNSQLELQGRKE